MLHTEINGTHYWVDANWAQASAPVYALTTDEWDGTTPPTLHCTQHQVADYGHREMRALRRLIEEDYITGDCLDDLEAAWEACVVDEYEVVDGEMVAVDDEED